MYCRQESYAVITGTLGQLLSQSKTLSSSSIPVKPGPKTSDITEQKNDPMKDVR